jgi:Fic family protein
MVTIVSKKDNNNTYYYLKHNTGSRQETEYLGKTIPDNIRQKKTEFLLRFYRKEWIPKLERIRSGYLANNKKMPKSLIEEKLNEFSIVFTYHTNRIEGSTLSLQDTYDLLMRGLTPAKKPESDTIETQRHRKVFLEIIKNRKPLSLSLIKKWHKEIFDSTKSEYAGMIRRYNVRISNSEAKFPDYSQVPSLLEKFFSWYKKSKNQIHPVELASLAHLKFVSIHPFGDGNGRISRLLMNYVLAEFDFPLFLIKYEGRLFYYHALERSQTEDDQMPFLQWFMKRYIAQHYKHYS